MLVVLKVQPRLHLKIRKIKCYITKMNVKSLGCIKKKVFIYNVRLKAVNP